jgi:hypothetical protein
LVHDPISKFAKDLDRSDSDSLSVEQTLRHHAPQPAEQVKSLNDVSSIEAGFPLYLYNAQMIRAFAYGVMHYRIVA